MASLATRAKQLLSAGEVGRVVGVGESGTEFAQRIKPEAPTVAVTTEVFNRNRAFRVLTVEPPSELDYPPVLVDDLAVSGLTLEKAGKAITPAAQTALVGLLFNSKKTLRAIRAGGIQDVRYVVRYMRQGDGTPPINSIDTLQAIPQRLSDLAYAYFPNNVTAFEAAVRMALQ
jgi:hypothetical protein